MGILVHRYQTAKTIFGRSRTKSCFHSSQRVLNDLTIVHVVRSDAETIMINNCMIKFTIKRQVNKRQTDHHYNGFYSILINPILTPNSKFQFFLFSDFQFFVFFVNTFVFEFVESILLYILLHNTYIDFRLDILIGIFNIYNMTFDDFIYVFRRYLLFVLF